MLVPAVLILGTLASLLAATVSHALPACPGQRFYLKTGEGLDIEFNRRPDCDVRFMAVERGSVERRLLYPSGKTDNRSIAQGPDDASAWAELPAKAYLKARSETVVRFLSERPARTAPVQHRNAGASNSGIPVEFHNATIETVSYYWINSSGKEISYGNIESGSSATINTFAGHVWRIKRASTHQTIKQFTITPQAKTISILPSDLSVTDRAKPLVQSPSPGASELAAGPFSRGARIITTDAVNVRSQPALSGSVAGIVQNRSAGTIVDGPHNQDGYLWWKIRYDNGREGWTANRFIRIAAPGQPSQRPQSTVPWNQHGGGTPMSFLSGVWNLIFSLFWLGVIGGVIYAVIKMLNAGPALIISHWDKLIESLQESPMAFYQSLERSIAERHIPHFSISRVRLPEGGVFSARREYLRVRRKDLIFDICAAPFGSGFFVSWWLGPKLAFLGFLYSLPVMGVVVQYFTRPWTYYRVDTALMFRDAVHNAVQDVIDDLTKAKGLRALSEAERKPVMRDFFAK